MNDWQIAKVSVTGNSHNILNIPCQDSCFVATNNDKQWVSLVVSDGAGSAKYSDKSSSLVVRVFGNALIDLSAELNTRIPGAWINDFVIEKILDTRKELRHLANSDDLKDYHCTLVACLIGPTGGFLIHIGDGALFGGTYSDIDFFNNTISKNCYISLPENGEYANETFFITEGDWVKHLRITPVPKLEWIVLGTDGGTSISMIADKEPKPGVIIPLLKKLNDADDKSKLDEILLDVLSDPRVDKITSDDKTLCFAFKPYQISTGTEIRFFESIPETVHKKNIAGFFKYFKRK